MVYVLLSHMYENRNNAFKREAFVVCVKTSGFKKEIPIKIVSYNTFIISFKKNCICMYTHNRQCYFQISYIFNKNKSTGIYISNLNDHCIDLWCIDSIKNNAHKKLSEILGATHIQRWIRCLHMDLQNGP